MDQKHKYKNKTITLMQALYSTYLGIQALAQSRENYEKFLNPVILSLGFEIGTQNDTEEFFIRLMVTLDREIKEDLKTKYGLLNDFEALITKKLICTSCKRMTRKETLNCLSLRIHPKSESLKRELLAQCNPGETTDEKAKCDLCSKPTSRNINIENIKPKQYFTVVIDKSAQKELNGRCVAPLKLKMSDLDMHLKTKEQKMKGKLTLHASVHHHGADHKRGHYTFRFYDLENFRVKIIDDSKITEESFKPEDEQITTLDSYIIL